MTELETLNHAKAYMEKLARGINPLDDSIIPDNDVVNNVRLSRCFFYVADVLRQVIDNGGITKQPKGKKLPFYLTAEQREAFAFSEDPLTISEVANRVNDLIAMDIMVRFSRTTLTEWLLSIGLIQAELQENGTLSKKPTAEGERLGITLENRVGNNGVFRVVVYNMDAQHFIIDNIDSVIDFGKIGKENQWKPWTTEQDQNLLDLYQKDSSIEEIATVMKRNCGAIRSRLRKLGAFR